MPRDSTKARHSARSVQDAVGDGAELAGVDGGGEELVADVSQGIEETAVGVVNKEQWVCGVNGLLDRPRRASLTASSNPLGVLAAYGESGRGAAWQIRTHIDTGRLMDLKTWLEIVVASGGQVAAL
jgi:hypothetical protein